MPFEDGKYKPDDVKTFSTVQGGMGKARKNTFLKGNGIPGPGEYKIKGFADDVISKGSKINLARLRIKEKEKLNEIEKERREKIREQWLEDKKSQLKMGIKDYYSSKINQKFDDNDNDHLNLQDNENDNEDD